LACSKSLHAIALAVAFVAVAIILGAGRPSARRASPEDDSADDGRMSRAKAGHSAIGGEETRFPAKCYASEFC
jgi:hypothetical protein